MATKEKKASNNSTGENGWPYGKKNYIIFAAALIVILAGFWSLAEGSITLAPILLAIGYCVLLPTALIIKGKPEEDESPQPD